MGMIKIISILANSNLSRANNFHLSCVMHTFKNHFLVTLMVLKILKIVLFNILIKVILVLKINFKVQLIIFFYL